MKKYIDPTEARIALDDEERKKKRKSQKPNNAKGLAKSAFREAAGKGKHGPMKTTEAGYRAAARDPRKVR
ncbi:hypothetical protein [Rhizobium sullae]|uniref:hypothetical protein n=1 Tax=Rhizobium sullae TaxID=50338 RepID=UPI000B34F19E|nr:hypothetical protein [Rhizobium sullae]